MSSHDTLLLHSITLSCQETHNNHPTTRALPYDKVETTANRSRSNTTRSNMTLILRAISAVKDDRHLDSCDMQSIPQGLVDTTGLLMRNTLSINTCQSAKKLPQQLTPHGLKSDSVADEKEVEYHEPPDGGYGWVIAVCAMLAVFATWGTNSAYGVFLNYYLESGTFEGATETDYAFIGGITVFIAQGFAPLLAVLNKVFGYKRVCYTGVAIQTAAYILASFATKLWQLYCTQAVMVGTSFTLIFIPTTLTLPTWFKKRLATAMGITVAGAGLGGVVFSLIINKMIHATGDQRWALRMCGIVNFVLCMVAVTIVHPYKTKRPNYAETCNRQFIWTNFKAIMSLNFFRNPALLVTGIWFSFIMLGYCMILYSVPSVGVLVGLSRTQGSNLIVVLNAAQTVGRPLMGHFADTFGRTNIAATFSLLLAVFVWGFWMNVSSYGALMAVLLLIGFTIGVGSSLSQAIASVVLDTAPQDLGSAWSWFSIGVALFQLPLEAIAMALRDRHAHRPYLHAQIFCGATFFTALVLILTVREYIVRRNFSRRMDAAIVLLAGRRSADAVQFNHVMDNVDRATLELRVQRYEKLLRKRYYLLRMFYPSIV